MRSLILAIAMLSLSACTIPLSPETPITVIENQAWQNFDRACEEFAVEQGKANDRFASVPPEELDIEQTRALDSHRTTVSDICSRQDNPGQNALLVRVHTTAIKSLDGRALP